MKKKARAKKKTAPRKGLVKKLATKLAARKPARKKLAVKKIPASLAAPKPAVKHGPLHLPSKPEPAYAILHKRDWATKPPPHEFRIPKR
ncbi:MAG: hypothetical protein ACM3ZT_05670 [Bacillota bacterium]